MRHLRRLSVTNWFGLLACITAFLYLTMALPDAAVNPASTQAHRAAPRSPVATERPRDHAGAALGRKLGPYLQLGVGRLFASFVVLMCVVCLVNLWSTARLRRAYWHDRRDA